MNKKDYWYLLVLAILLFIILGPAADIYDMVRPGSRSKPVTKKTHQPQYHESTTEQLLWYVSAFKDKGKVIRCTYKTLRTVKGLRYNSKRSIKRSKSFKQEETRKSFRRRIAGSKRHLCLHLPGAKATCKQHPPDGPIVYIQLKKNQCWYGRVNIHDVDTPASASEVQTRLYIYFNQ